MNLAVGSRSYYVFHYSVTFINHGVSNKLSQSINVRARYVPALSRSDDRFNINMRKIAKQNTK